MTLTIAAIRARHVRPPPAEAPPPPAPARPTRTEAADWIATVGRADITRTRRADGGYELHVGRRRVALVEPADQDGRHVVVNLAAGRIRSPAIARAMADTMALRIARTEALD